MEIPPTEYSKIDESILNKGADVALVNRNSGWRAHGKLKENIEVGKPIGLGDSGWGSPTMKTITINEVTGRVSMEDNKSQQYELLDRSFKGLDLDTSLGTVHMPLDSQLAKLDGRVDLLTPTFYGEKRIFINKPVLKGVLLESGGAQIFRGMESRFFVLAKVGNIHLPFYKSLSGTDGKNEGEWYPFFGFASSPRNSEWIIKGGANSKGKMPYHPKIDEVTELLNQNLKFPGKVISNGGKIGRVITQKLGWGDEPDIVTFDLNNHLIYHPWTPGKNHDKYIKDITGYDPHSVTYSSGSSSWIDSIVKSIK